MVEAISLAHARERSANIARGMMDAHTPGYCDWSAWRILIATPDEGGCDDPFPGTAGQKPDGGGAAAPPKGEHCQRDVRAQPIHVNAAAFANGQHGGRERR